MNKEEPANEAEKKQGGSCFFVSLSPISFEMRISHWMLTMVVTGEFDESHFSEMMSVKY